jgi:hypothetical protein
MTEMLINHFTLIVVMSNTESGGKLVVFGVLFVLLFFGLIRIFINSSGLFFDLELVGLIFLMILVFVGFVGYEKKWGLHFFYFTFLFYLGNLVLIWYFHGSLYFVLLFISVIGIVLSVPKKIKICSNKPNKKTYLNQESNEGADDFGNMETNLEPHSVVFDSSIMEEKKNIKKSPVKTAKKVVAVEHSPGKFLASSSSNIYHAPKCEWAKKIKKERRVWFSKKEKAWEKGYRAHNCVKA